MFTHRSPWDCRSQLHSCLPPPPPPPVWLPSSQLRKQLQRALGKVDEARERKRQRRGAFQTKRETKVFAALKGHIVLLFHVATAPSLWWSQHINCVSLNQGRSSSALSLSAAFFQPNTNWACSLLMGTFLSAEIITESRLFVGKCLCVQGKKVKMIGECARVRRLMFDSVQNLLGSIFRNGWASQNNRLLFLSVPVFLFLTRDPSKNGCVWL